MEPKPSDKLRRVSAGFKAKMEEGDAGVKKFQEQMSEEDRQKALREKRAREYKLEQPKATRMPTDEELESSADLERGPDEDKYSFRQRQIDAAAKKKAVMKDAMRDMRKTPPAPMKPKAVKKKPEEEDVY